MENETIFYCILFPDTDLARRLGHELIKPNVSSKYGVCFRLLTVITNTMTLITLLNPTRITSKYLFISLIWNFYTISIIAENMVHIIWAMLVFEVNFSPFITIALVGIFMICFQSKLILHLLCFYEYLNC